MANEIIKKPIIEPVAANIDELEKLRKQMAKQQETIKELQNEKITNRIKGIGKRVFGNDEKTGYKKYSKYIKFPDNFDFNNDVEIEKVMNEVKKDFYVETKQEVNDFTYKPQVVGAPTVKPVDEIETTNESGFK